MSPKARREYIEDMRRRYAAATLVGRSALLDEVVAVTGYHRKHANALLCGPAHRPVKRRRRRVYGELVTAALVAIWQAAGYPWSARLKAMLPLWVPWLQKRMPIDEPTRLQLLRISARSIDRLLKPKRSSIRRQRNSLTRSGAWLIHQIPIRTERWDATQPGWLEIDLVAHCGNSAGGEFICSLNSTDIASGWTETRAVMGKGKAAVVAALDDIRQSLPFSLVGIDSDSGSEFINEHLLRWCRQHNIAFTRSRPYKKNDNAHIEQKNWTHVRKVFGWLRFDSADVLELMNSLYKCELRTWMNYFQPSVKLVRKERVGSRVRKYYDAPQTPFDRLCAIGITPQNAHSIDPFQLEERITTTIAQIAAKAATAIPRTYRYGPQPTISRPTPEMERYTRKILAGAMGGR